MFPAQFRVKFVLNCTRSVTQFLSVDCCVCILDISCTCGMTDTTPVMCYAQCWRESACRGIRWP